MFSSFDPSVGSVGGQRSTYLSDLSKTSSFAGCDIRNDGHIEQRFVQYDRLARGEYTNGTQSRWIAYRHSGKFQLIKLD